MDASVSETAKRIERLAETVAASCRTAARSPDPADRSFAVKRAERCISKIKSLLEREERAGHGADLEADLQKRGLLT